MDQPVPVRDGGSDQRPVEISVQRANSRVRRFERLRLVGTAQRSPCEPRAVWLADRCAELLGQPRRRPPRPDVQREHEDAIVWLSTQLERQHTGAAVLTERECRRRETDGTSRYSVAVVPSGPRTDRTRWPDLVVDDSDRRTAYEIEFSPKHSARLQAILRGYMVRGTYDEVVFLVRSSSLAQRLQSLARTARPSPHLVPKRVETRVEPFPAHRGSGVSARQR